MLDEYLRALADDRRRRILWLLARDDSGEIPIDKVVNEPGDHDDPDRVRTTLRHCHLPKLDRLGLVSWDREREVVSKGPNFDDVRPVLETLDTVEPPVSADD